VSKCRVCVCRDRLEQVVGALDSGVDYSRKVDGHCNLQEIVELARLFLQGQLEECKRCERSERDTEETKRVTAEPDPVETFKAHIPRS
jgi:hypothetical protein